MTKTGLVNNNPKHELTESDARKGGINSGKVRAAKKSLREKAQLLMSLSIQDKDELIKATELGLDAKDVDIEMMNLIHMLNIVKKENFNSVGAFNSLKELTTEETNNNDTPSVQINIVDNSELEKVMYENNN